MNYDKLSPWLKKTTKTRYKKNQEMFRDKGWYKSRLVRNWMFVVMGISVIIIGLFFITADITTMSPDADKTSLIVTGSIMIALGVVFDLYLLTYEIWINKITNELYGELSNENNAKEAFDEWRNKQKQLADERERKYNEKKQLDELKKSEKQKEKESNLKKQREILKKELEEEENNGK